MKCHRIEELLELLEPEWQKDQQMNLLQFIVQLAQEAGCLLYTSPSPRDRFLSRMPSSA